MTHYYDTFPTPAGPFSLAVDGGGSVVATAFGSLDALNRRFQTEQVVRDPARASWGRREVTEFLEGKRRDFAVPLAPEGTPFQQRVWSALKRIPFGQTRSYRDLATELGNPGASRAVGRANATNPICLLIPCHRVIAADGALAGFAFGEVLKRFLLALEGAVAAEGRKEPCLCGSLTK